MPANVAATLGGECNGRRGTAALESLWALYGCVGLDDATAGTLLTHPDADVRAWCVRLVGDEPTASLPWQRDCSSWRIESLTSECGRNSPAPPDDSPPRRGWKLRGDCCCATWMG